MSKKSESKLPSELNENWGVNYFMDGFDFDMDYGKGLQDNPGANPVPQPSTSGMAQLPDGMVLALAEELAVDHQEDEGAMDLEGLGIVASVETNLDPDVDRTDVGVVDYTWLSNAEQDPTRLPDKPVDNGIPELQEAWGDRTDGIVRIELRERDQIKYEDAFQGPEDDDTLNREKLASLVRSAMRRSAAGQSLRQIKEEILSPLGPKAAQLINPMKAIMAEHGLVGNVYVRASAYPGLERGKWSKALAKAAKNARYIIACPGVDCSNCACSMGLKVVDHPDQIDWNDAYEHYAPGLSSTGRLDRMATVADKRETLRRAFLAAEKAPRLHVETAKVMHTMPADRVSAEEARKTVAEYQPAPREVLTNEDSEHKSAEARLQKKLGAFVRANLLTSEESQTLQAWNASVGARLRMAHVLASRVRTAQYSGGMSGDARVRISAEEFEAAGAQSQRHEHNARVASVSEDAMRQKLLEGFKRVQAQYSSARKKLAKVAQVVAKETKKGSALRKWVDGLFTDGERDMVRAALDPVLINGGYYDDPDAGKPRDYQGGVIREAAAQRAQTVISPQEVARTVKWARQQMSEGFAGEQLDYLIDHRVEPRVKQASSERLFQIRRKHEGLSGHLYVDAAAYATPKGTKGCDDGALKHRTNGLKFVMAMDRCSGCVFKNADGMCQKYNKVLVDQVPAKDAAEYQRQALASHKMSDAEEAASMFSGNDVRQAANPNPVEEFGLHNSALDDVDADGDVGFGSLEGIFFGGFEI